MMFDEILWRRNADNAGRSAIPKKTLLFWNQIQKSYDYFGFALKISYFCKNLKNNDRTDA